MRLSILFLSNNKLKAKTDKTSKRLRGHYYAIPALEVSNISTFKLSEVFRILNKLYQGHSTLKIARTIKSTRTSLCYNIGSKDCINIQFALDRVFAHRIHIMP